ncbi:MAG: monovalent cation/H(+) antiporter subunit G [Acidimicrobiales bacterium]
MSWQAILADVVLAVAVLMVALSSVGVLVMRDVYQKSHFVTPIALAAPVLVAVAVSIEEGWREPTAQTWIAVGFLCIAGPVLSHATVRAARVRECGDWRSREGLEPGGSGTNTAGAPSEPRAARRARPSGSSRPAGDP